MSYLFKADEKNMTNSIMYYTYYNLHNVSNLQGPNSIEEWQDVRKPLIYKTGKSVAYKIVRWIILYETDAPVL